MSIEVIRAGGSKEGPEPVGPRPQRWSSGLPGGAASRAASSSPRWKRSRVRSATWRANRPSAEPCSWAAASRSARRQSSSRSAVDSSPSSGSRSMTAFRLSPRATGSIPVPSVTAPKWLAQRTVPFVGLCRLYFIVHTGDVGDEQSAPTPAADGASRRMNSALLLLAQVVGRFAFQHGETRVIVGELRQVGECDLAGDDRIVRADVGLRVPGPMLELHAEPHPELLKIAPQRPEVDPELGRNGARLIFREIPLGGQLNCSHCRLLGCHCLLPCSLDR